jgi:hypothetical protein
MDVVRARLGSAVEWVVAAVFLLATLAVGSMVLRELRAAASVGPDTTRAAAVVSAASALPTHVAGRAVLVPLLILAPEKEIRVGDTAARVAAVLGREAETGVQQSDIGPVGERTTRYYDYSGTRFALVFESPDRGGSLKVTAIYLQ